MTAIPASRPLAAIFWMLAGGLSFVGVTGIVRHLGTDLPATQSAFLRFGWGVVLLLPSLWMVLRAGIPRQAVPLMAWRGALHTLAVVCWFYAMARIPVAEVTAIGFVSPVCVTIGAALFFSERIALRRALAIAVALVGAVVVLRPGLRELGDGHMAQLLASVAFAGSFLLMKRLTQVISPVAVVALLSLSVTLGLAPFAIAAWVPVTALQVGWLALVAAFATLGHYCMTRAYMLAPLAVVQPVTFLQLVWATLLGALVFGEGVDPFVLLGGGIIIAAVSYITWREYVAKRRQVTPALNETKL